MSVFGSSDLGTAVLDLAQLQGIAMPGATEMMIFLVVVLVLFGGAKLPSLMRNLGRSANEFKRGLNDTSEESDESDKNGNE
ncbi:MAG: twin-arginine translocase TatA/TatE family subunit [Planctomycetota bacterium]